MLGDRSTTRLKRWIGGLAAALGISQSACVECEDEFCDDYLSITFEREMPWHGTYEVELDLEGEAVHCSFHVPVAWDSNAITCDDGGTVVGPFGVRHHGSTPTAVAVAVSIDGHVLAAETLEPRYETPSDWRRACGPPCKQAVDETIVVASTEPSTCTSYCERGWCDPLAQDCGAGEKCVAWDELSNGTWNALRCEAEATVPKQPGEACSVRGSALSGFDDCVAGSMCFHVDASTLVGECVAFCTGSLDAPVCASPSDQCVIANDDVLPLCLPA